MRELRKWAWVAVVATAAAAPAAAQQPTTSGVTGAPGLSSGVGQGNTLSSGGNFGSQGNNSNSSSSSSSSGTPLMATQAAPKLTAPSGTATGALQKSNFLAGYYGNPYYQGLISAQTNAVPGGFGSVLMPVTASNANSRGAGGAGGLGGRGGLTNANQSGILIPLPVQITYSSQLMFPAPPVAATRMQTDLRLMIDGVSGIANPKGVQIITDADNNVTLRGTVKDSDEARFVEGLVRVTPGVRAIANELTATSAPSGK